MSVQIIKQPNSYCFAGNPVSFVFSSSTNDEFRVVVNVAGESLELSLYPYGTSAPYQADLELSDLLQKYFNVPTISDSDIITPIDNFSLPYSISIDGVTLFSGVAFQGGVSRSFSKLLVKNRITDIFKYRLANRYHQFLFTTRTNGRDVKLKYSELYPFVFIHPGIAISFRSEQGDVLNTTPKAKGMICHLDVSYLCYIFNSSFGYVPSVIEVIIEDRTSFNISLEHPISVEDKSLIRFKNSLGAFEVIELTGTAYHAPQFDEEYTWQSNVGGNVFEQRRERVGSRDTIEIESGFKTRPEMDHLQDMIKSDEAYFIYPDGFEQRCHVSVDTLRFRNRIMSPTSVPLKIRMVDDEVYVSPYRDFFSPPFVLSTESYQTILTENNNNNILV